MSLSNQPLTDSNAGSLDTSFKVSDAATNSEIDIREYLAPNPIDLEVTSISKLNPEDSELIQAAIDVLPNALDHHSGRANAVALRDEGGLIAEGVNVDQAHRWNNCAEKNGIRTATKSGLGKILELSLHTSDSNSQGEHDSTLIRPCGSCRDVLSLKAQKDTRVIMSADGTNEVHISSMDALMPLHFSKSEYLYEKYSDSQPPFAQFSFNAAALDEGWRELFNQALSARSDSPEFIDPRHQSGAAALTASGSQFTSGSFNYGSYQEGSVKQVILDADNVGQHVLSRIAWVAEVNPLTGHLSAPDGSERQLLFERSQFSHFAGVNLEIALGLIENDEITYVLIGQPKYLLPGGAGPIDHYKDISKHVEKFDGA